MKNIVLLHVLWDYRHENLTGQNRDRITWTQSYTEWNIENMAFFSVSFLKKFQHLFLNSDGHSPVIFIKASIKH